MSRSGGHDDKMAEAKAVERSALLADMLVLKKQGAEGDSPFAESRNESVNENDAHPPPCSRVGAFSVKTSPAAVTAHRNSTTTVSKNGTPVSHQVMIPSVLGDMERKISGQLQEDFIAGSSKDTSAKKLSLPGSVTKFHHTTSNRQQQAPSAQERDLLSKSGGGGGGGEIGNNNNSNNNNNNAAATLLLVEKATFMGATVNHMIMRTPFHSNSSSSGEMAANNKNVHHQQLPQQESNALLKQRLPREMMSENDSQVNVEATHAASQTSSSAPKVMFHDNDVEAAAEPLVVVVTAEIVDDAKEREKITKEAQDALISNAVVATTVEDHDDLFKEAAAAAQSQCMWRAMVVACILFVLTAVVLAGVCGTGNCSSSSTRQSAAARAKSITDLIASISLSSLETTTATPKLEYPFSGTAEERSPEQEALDHLIDGDVLQLSVVASQGDETNANNDANWRLIQRYALLVIWFTNGPWVDTMDASSSAAWLVGADECGWSSVKCDDNGVVVQLNLEGRELMGTLPRALGLLSDLNELQLQHNNLEGSLNDTVAIFLGMAALTSLNLGRNHFNGTIPAELLVVQFKSFKALALNDNAITGNIPSSIGTMTLLESLNLSGNYGLTGTIPTSLAALTSLTFLGLGSSGYSRSTPIGFFDGMKNLTHLDLGGVETNGEAAASVSLSQLSGLSKLTHLAHAAATVLEGTIPPEVVDWWPHMSFISLTKCNITGTIPSALAQWTLLEHINLSSNQLTGSIPLSLYSAWSDTLKYCSVPFNRIVGSLASEIGRWSNLESLDVRNNHLTGSLPTTIGLLIYLELLWMSENRFTGTIPTEVMNLPSYGYADYNSNDFVGVAPYCQNESKLIPVKVDCLEVSCPCCSVCN